MVLNNDVTPEQVKAMSLAEKTALCAEIRALLIAVVSKNGGHLASNLGTVELSVALHSVFTTPEDSLIFDVGHQSYTHKILTGRCADFYKLRQEDGVSGFPRPSESEHDAFIGGHAGTAVSAGLGIAAAKRLCGEQGNVVAVAGDGSFTNGGIYEGLNNAGRDKTAGNFIVVLNDNGMCISKNSGAFASYLSQFRLSKGYLEAKSRVKSILGRAPLGKGVTGAVSGTKRFIKGALIHDNLFENLGFKYFGPVDGHNLEELIYILEVAKNTDEPCLVHIKTKKGKGHMPAEENAGHYHGLESPIKTVKADTYSDVFGREIARIGGGDNRICLITAAMKYATGCNYFAKEYPERFFDAGIAEGHAATFCAGLAAKGLIPVFAVYSTFLQRSFDQLLHDAAIEKLRIVLAVDRAGLSGEDGATHQGTFDVGLLSLIPNTTVYAPFTAAELRLCLNKAVYEDTGIAAIRYPRGVAYDNPNEATSADYVLYNSETGKKADTLIITYGRPVKPALRLLKQGIDVLRLVKIHPLSDGVFDIIKGYGNAVFFEEGRSCGGVSEKISRRLTGVNYMARGIDDFVPAADVERQMSLCGFDEESMMRWVNGLQQT